LTASQHHSDEFKAVQRQRPHQIYFSDNVDYEPNEFNNYECNANQSSLFHLYTKLTDVIAENNNNAADSEYFASVGFDEAKPDDTSSGVNSLHRDNLLYNNLSSRNSLVKKSLKRVNNKNIERNENFQMSRKAVGRKARKGLKGSKKILKKKHKSQKMKKRLFNQD
jgi:hypothetical protein